MCDSIFSAGYIGNDTTQACYLFTTRSSFSLPLCSTADMLEASPSACTLFTFYLLCLLPHPFFTLFFCQLSVWDRWPTSSHPCQSCCLSIMPFFGKSQKNPADIVKSLKENVAYLEKLEASESKKCEKVSVVCGISSGSASLQSHMSSMLSKKSQILF